MELLLTNFTDALKIKVLLIYFTMGETWFYALTLTIFIFSVKEKNLEKCL